MIKGKNLPILILVILIVLMYFCAPKMKKEEFSDSGLNMSNRYCDKLAHTYYRPDENNEQCRVGFHNRICGNQRRDSIDFPTSNYFTQGGVLI